MLAAVGAYSYWTTRDTCPVESVIPAQMSYHVVADDVLANTLRPITSFGFRIGVRIRIRIDIRRVLGRNFRFLRRR